MALNSTGKISLAGTVVGESIQKELNGDGSTTVSIGDTALRNLAGVPSGAISLDNFHGKVETFSFNLNSGVNLDLRTQAIAAGWNQIAYLIATIPSGNTIYSNSTSSPALTISGSFPKGALLINNGTVVGAGGNGGQGSDYYFHGAYNGGAGGNAVSVSVAVNIQNNGTLAGGGGGGGGGGSYRYAYASGKSTYYGYGAGGGGGGGGGIINGVGGPASMNQAQGGYSQAGANGTSTAGGGGGGGTAGGYTGGSGGGLGQAGNTGDGGAAGGAAGYYLTGNGYVTWTATGSRLGNVA